MRGTLSKGPKEKTPENGDAGGDGKGESLITRNWGSTLSLMKKTSESRGEVIEMTRFWGGRSFLALVGMWKTNQDMNTSEFSFLSLRGQEDISNGGRESIKLGSVRAAQNNGVGGGENRGRKKKDSTQKYRAKQESRSRRERKLTLPT